MFWRDRILVLGGALCLAAHLLAALPTYPSLVDDAWISARYAANLAAGNGPVYNAGEWIEGYTNLLWVVLLAGSDRLGIDVERAMPAFGLLSSLGLVAGVLALAWQLDATKSRWSLVPAAIVAVDGHAAVVATNGIESSQFAAMTVWAAAGFVAGWSIPASILCFLLPAVRPEGLAVAAAVAVGFGWKWRSPLPSVAAILGTALVYGTRWLWFGDVVPNTYRAKAHKSLTSQVWFNLDYLSPDAPWWIAVALVLLAGLALSRRDPVRLWLWAITLGLVAVAFSVDMWMPGGRLLLPAVALTFAVTGSFLGAFFRPRWPYLLVTAAALGLTGLGPLPDYVRGYDDRHTAVPDNPASQAARFLRDHLPPASTVVIRDAGIFAFHWGITNRVAEIHPRALTQPHPDRKNAAFDRYAPANPEVFVATVADPNWTRWYYPEDQARFAKRTMPYRYLGRVIQHFRRHYDICVRADLGVPDLPAGLVENDKGRRLCEAAPPKPVISPAAPPARAE